MSGKQHVFYFFKMLGCPACERFETEMFQKLINDPEVRENTALDLVTFGVDRETGEQYPLDSVFPESPELAAKVRYAPFLWLSSSDNISNGKEYNYTENSTYTGLRQWILDRGDEVHQGARLLMGLKEPQGFRARRR